MIDKLLLGTGLLTLFALPLAAQVDGTLDTGFGDAGAATWELILGFTAPQTRVEALAPSDQELFALGRRGGSEQHLAFAGYDADGQAVEDHDCHSSTGSVFPFGVESEALDGVVTEAGDLLVGGSLTVLGTESTRRALVARFDLAQAGCELDPAFAANGWRLFDVVAPCNTTSCQVIALAQIRPATGAVAATRTILLIRSVVSLVQSRFFLYAVDDDGELDTGFDGNGLREITLAGSDGFSVFGRLALDARGRIYFLASAYDASAPGLDRDLFLFRYLANGAVDTTFSGDGVHPVALDDAVDEVPDDLTVASDGTVLASFFPAGGGATTIYALQSSGASYLVLPDNLRAPRLASQGDGAFVATSDFTEASGGDGFRGQRRRFAGLNAVLDTTFSGDGLVTHDYDYAPGQHEADRPTELVLWSGRPVVAGTAESSASEVSYLMRLENHYIFADGFEQSTAALWSNRVP